MRLEAKTALVTGASGAIGRDTALALTCALAVELGPHGIRVNAIEPRHVLIDAQGLSTPTPEQRAHWQNIPLGRPGRVHPELLAARAFDIHPTRAGGFRAFVAAVSTAGPRLGHQRPIHRPGLPDDIAESIVFLASPAAGYISGAVLRVDGGRMARTPVLVQVNLPAPGQP